MSGASKMFNRLKHTEEGVNTMCAIVEDYASIKQKETLVTMIDRLCNGRTLEEACQMVEYTVDEYNEAKQAIQNNDSDSGIK